MQLKSVIELASSKSGLKDSASLCTILEIVLQIATRAKLASLESLRKQAREWLRSAEVSVEFGKILGGVIETCN